ncbi:uncharacterized protein LOC127123449 [Lathyrus oleraceus]|uniref:uncharacterized protein LOC127123449 n=1 Tax=Pisum sativum TaxID=3888 RepID=UPI0021D377BA|nr:uncharacterized protein LOC127123449 [Pisum sativum]
MVSRWCASNPIVWIGPLAGFGGDGISEKLSEVMLINVIIQTCGYYYYFYNYQALYVFSIEHVIKMDGRNNVAIDVALQTVAQVVQNQPNVGGNDKFQHLGKFQRKNPPTLKGRYDPDGVMTWLKEIERNFRVMDCSKARKMRFGMHMLDEEVDDWWINTRQVLDVEVGVIGRFPELVNNFRIYEDDGKARSTHYKGLSKRRGKHNLNCGKPYSAIADKGKQRVADGKRPSGGGAPTSLKCYRCGELGHCFSECKSDKKKCYKCRNPEHVVADCKKNVVTCYNCGEPGHINTHCQKPKKALIGGKVFALTGTQTSNDERLIRGMCYINNTPLIAVIDTGATHSFIAADCVKRIGLVVSSMNGEMLIETPAKGSGLLLQFV